MGIEIQYTRKLMKSYMRLRESEMLSAWEQKMIMHVPAEGIIFAESVQWDEKSELWYDITGKQSLEAILGTETLRYEMLRRILLGIYEAVEHLESVLLCADALLLLPECIYIDYRTDRMFFCYYPGNPMAVTDAFAELMEGLLIKLAHDDERAVELAYGVYEHAAGGRLDFGEFKELLNTRYDSEEYGFPDTDMDIGPETESNIGTDIEEDIGGEANIGQYNMHRKVRFDIFRTLERWTGYWREQRQKMLRWKNRRKKDEKEEPFVFEPEPEEEKKPARPTVLLTELSGPPEGILRYQGEGNGRDMVIDTTPYTIGSENTCDGYLPSATVSRRHARISYREGIYFIEDLNSANGTYVGGELLGYRTKVSLQKNEIVVFADEKFRFI